MGINDMENEQEVLDSATLDNQVEEETSRSAENESASEGEKQSVSNDVNDSSSKKKKRKVFKTLAKVISYLFFPVLMPIYGTFMLFNMKLFTYYPTQYVNAARTTIYIFGIILPCLSFIILKVFKAISDVRVPRKEERILPYICIACCYLYCAYLLFRYAMPMWVIDMVLCVAFVILVESIVSKFWRISGHATSMGMMAGAIMVAGYCTYTNVTVTLCVFVFLSGIVGTARLYLNRHTHAQLLVGFFFGLLSVILISYLNPGQVFRLI
jgi:membrane-associated phospholipid phosphatase